MRRVSYEALLFGKLEWMIEYGVTTSINKTVFYSVLQNET